MAILGGDAVGPEESCFEGHVASEAQQPSFAAHGQVVTRLNFNSGHPAALKFGESREAGASKLIIARRSGRGHGASNATAVIAFARHAGGELITSRSRKDEVGL